MNYFLQGLGAFFGVLAGTAVTILTQHFILWRDEKQKVQNLKFEIQFNLKQIERWSEYLKNYRDAIASGSLNLWAEYFDFSHIIKATTEDMIKTGLVYKKLSDVNVSLLLSFISQFSINYEALMNQKIIAQKESFNKGLALLELAYLEKTLKTNKGNLEAVLKVLP